MNTNDSHGQADVAKPGADAAADAAAVAKAAADKAATDAAAAADGGADGDGDGAADKNNRQESDADRLSRFQRQTNQLRKKQGLAPIDFDQAPEPKGNKGKESKPSVELELAQRAFLMAVGLKTKAEVQLALDAATSSGKPLDEVIETKWFKEDLETVRTQAAIPSGKNRSGNPTGQDTVEYWLVKDQLPPASNPKLQQQYVNAKAARGKNQSVFSATPVVR